MSTYGYKSTYPDVQNGRTSYDEVTAFGGQCGLHGSAVCGRGAEVGGDVMLPAHAAWRAWELLTSLRGSGTGLSAAVVLSTALLGADPALTQEAASVVPSARLSVRGLPAPRGHRGGFIYTPKSSRPTPGKLHTNYKIFVPNQSAPSAPYKPQARDQTSHANSAGAQAAGGPPFAGYFAETPASLACIYGLVTAANGCDPNVVTTNAAGGTKAIAVIAVGGDDPTALQDLQAYSTQFGLPQPNLTIYYVNNTKPAKDANIALETSLDLQITHAMSPNAPLILVEGPQTDAADFGLPAVADLAAQKVQEAGGGVVSMSYGGSEFPTEGNDESHFSTPSNVVFFASSGDAAGTLWPASSPNVVAVGGTGTARQVQATNTPGAFLQEVVWDQTGGGFSAAFPTPPYQNAIASRFPNNTMRTTPDIAADADPATGVWVNCTSGCDSSSGSWYIVGGTSVSSPLTASMFANKGPLYSSSMAQLTYIYQQLGTANFFDVSRGFCGDYAGLAATAGTASNHVMQYDLCTGVGSPRFTPTAPISTLAAKN